MDVNDDNPIEIGGRIYKVPVSQRPSNKKYRELKNYCKRKGIEFQFTYEDWIAFWAKHPNAKRGQGKDGFSMIRVDKNKPFCAENVQIVSNFTKFSVGGLRRPSARPVSTPSGVFKSTKQAAVAYGVDARTVLGWLRKGIPGWSYVEKTPNVGENS